MPEPARVRPVGAGAGELAGERAGDLAKDLAEREAARAVVGFAALGVARSSSRPMSSKWPMSARTLPSSLCCDWKDDDTELLEVVMPGGVPGLCSIVPAFCAELMATWPGYGHDGCWGIMIV